MFSSLPCVSLLTIHTTAAQQSYTPVNSADFFPFDISLDTVEGDPNYTAPIFPVLPFNQYLGSPILLPNPANNFESAYLYDPTAMLLNETIFLLYRAQNASKVSSVGLAWSTEGYNFTRLNHPILSATEPWEQGGGTEDPESFA